MQRHKVDIAVQDLYATLVEKGNNPMTVAASFIVSAFIIYASELPKKEYLEVVEGIFNKADKFVEKRYNQLN